MNDQKLLNDILVKSRAGEKYVVWKKNRKTWIIPMEHIRNGLAMYQPTTVKGKLFKQLFPLVVKKNKLNKKKFEKIRLEFAPEIQKMIEQFAKDEEDLNVSIYAGDPISWQNEKATIQICCGSEVAGYLKVTNQEKVKRIFRHETNALEYLRKKNINGIPQIAYEDGNGKFAFLSQNVEKKLRKSVRLKLSKKHLDFLWDVNQVTSKELDYSESEIAYYIEYLKTHTEAFTDEQRKIIWKGIQIIEGKLKESRYTYSFFHGDFTPWNVLFEKNEIQVFDFEYAHYMMPQYMDVFHFITQSSMLGKKAGIGGVMHEYRKNYRKISRYVEQPEFVYICYLVFIMAFYLLRTENATEKYEREFNIWVRVLGNLT